MTSRDAVGGQPGPDTAPGDGADSDAGRGQSGAGGFSKPTFTLTGADLSVSAGRDLLLGHSRLLGGTWALIGLHAVPLALLCMAFVSRRRADIDPATLQRRRVLGASRQRVQDAAALPRRDGTRQIAGALREMIAEVPEARSADIDQLLSECDVIVYDPGSDSAQAVDETLASRARDLARRIAETWR